MANGNELWSCYRQLVMEESDKWVMWHPEWIDRLNLKRPTSPLMNIKGEFQLRWTIEYAARASHFRYFDRYSEFILIIVIFIICACLRLDRNILLLVGAVFGEGDDLRLLIVASIDNLNVGRLWSSAKIWPFLLTSNLPQKKPFTRYTFVP